MLRTRDYFLVLLTVAFLVIGIGATLADSYRQGGLFDGSRPLLFVDDTDVERTAMIEEVSNVDRASRLASLREKIAAGGLLSLSPSPAVVTDMMATTSDEVIEVPPEDQVAILCGNYRAFSGSWPQDIRFEEAEGARIVYVESAESVSPQPTGSTSTVVDYAPSKEVIVELPVRSAAMGMQNCIPLDVIGIARDGSLIRNNTVSVYAIFGAETLVGYALDGYPIYGSDTVATDSCGGVTKGGQYRYQISLERETIINCYSGVPVQL